MFGIPGGLVCCYAELRTMRRLIGSSLALLIITGLVISAYITQRSRHQTVLQVIRGPSSSQLSLTREQRSLMRLRERQVHLRAERVSRGTSRHRLVHHSRVEAAAEQPTVSIPDDLESWRNSAEAHKVIECESSGDYGMVEKNGDTWYFGAWSANEDFVRTYGNVDPWDYVVDGKFTLSRSAQDLMAYRGWQVRGWEPWVCA